MAYLLNYSAHNLRFSIHVFSKQMLFINHYISRQHGIHEKRYMMPE